MKLAGDSIQVAVISSQIILIESTFNGMCIHGRDVEMEYSIYVCVFYFFFLFFDIQTPARLASTSPGTDVIISVFDVVV